MNMGKEVTIKNKKAYFDYAFLEQYIAGIVLTGTEIKSIREGKASLVDTFCYIKDNEIWVKNSYIAAYDNSGYTTHEERRDRKLLLTKKEIKSLAKEVLTPGLTIVPILLFINEKGFCKVKIALCKGKKEFDKRESIKEKDNKRELDRVLKSY